jgi:hypothetical protein
VDKLPLLFAAIRRVAQRSKDADLVEYLDHASHNSDAFIQEAKKHEDNVKNLDDFIAAHELLTHPGQPVRTFTQAEFDAAISAAIKKAQSERGKEEGM